MTGKFQNRENKNIFLNAQATKSKTDKWDHIKLQTSVKPTKQST